jgi:chemotaxis protein methyltransferase CheR
MDCTDSDIEGFKNGPNPPGRAGFDTARGALFDTRRMQAGRMAGTGLEDLVAVLRRDGKPHLHRAEAEALAIGETSFFRDRPMFEELRERILPELIVRRGTERRLRLWSAGCSTGQETYSLAMMLSEHFPELAGWDVRVIGTDVSEPALQCARSGRYRRSEVERGLPRRFLERQMERQSHGWAVSERVRGLCQFILGDLREMNRAVPPFDLVLLRNVLLYLAPIERGEVLKRVRKQMAPDGVLILGAAERAEDSTALFAGELTLGCSVYRPANGR